MNITVIHTGPHTYQIPVRGEAKSVSVEENCIFPQEKTIFPGERVIFLKREIGCPQSTECFAEISRHTEKQGIMKRTISISVAMVLIMLSLHGRQACAANGKNVLFLIVDDLRPQIFNYQIDHYNTDLMQTPNLDQLQTDGIVFENASCQVPVCGASRLSVMTGARPYKVPGQNYGRFWAFHDRLDEASPSGLPAGMNHPLDGNGNPAPTLPMIFKLNGYNTQAIGKVFHTPADGVDAWTHGAHRGGEGIYRVQTVRTAYEMGTGMTDEDYEDGQYKDLALAALQNLSGESNPFFLALGFIKPHLPFNSPKKYWDLYDRNDITISESPLVPTGAPWQSLHNWGELRGYVNLAFTDASEQTLTNDYSRTLIHAYYACVSYVDAMIGMVLDGLDALGIRDNTIVCLWGDHGWNLGEHNLWAKHCLYETSVRAPLYFDAPGYPGGLRSRALAEFVDMYPTLCELTGIDLPDHLEGTSLVPLLDNPDLSWKGASYSNWHAGFSIRTDRYRYTEFTDAADNFQANMLYDHQADPLESVNIANVAGNEALVATLSELLNAGWERAVTGGQNTPVPFSVLPDGTLLEGEMDPVLSLGHRSISVTVEEPTVALTAEVVNPDGGETITWSVVEGGGSLSPTTGEAVTFTHDGAGTYEVMVSIGTDSSICTIEVIDWSTSHIKINCGGSAISGTDWIADYAFVTGGATFTWNGTPADPSGVENAGPAEVYFTVRRSSPHSYEFPVSNGDYTVRLHFVDMYHADNTRSTNYTIEGQAVETNFRIPGDPTVKEYSVTVSDDDGLTIQCEGVGGSDVFEAGLEIIGDAASLVRNRAVSVPNEGFRVRALPNRNFRIEIPERGTVEILGTNGRMLGRFHSDDASCHIWETSRMPSGIYLIRGISPAHSFTRRVTIMN